MFLDGDVDGSFLPSSFNGYCRMNLVSLFGVYCCSLKCCSISEVLGNLSIRAASILMCLEPLKCDLAITVLDMMRNITTKVKSQMLEGIAASE